MKNTFLILIILFLFSCKTKITTDSSTVKIKELSYGTSSSKILTTEHLKNSPSGNHIVSDYKLNIIKKSDDVEAKIGVQFGSEYIIYAKENKPIELTIKWTYPKGVTDKMGKELFETKYNIIKMTNEYSYSNFTIEDKNELVKGDWILEIFTDNSKLYKRVFHLK